MTPPDVATPPDIPVAPKPRGCLSRHIQANSIKFAGRYINLKEMGELYDMDRGYLSKIFQGARTPSTDYCQKIATALHMSLGDFVNALADHREKMLRKRAV